MSALELIDQWPCDAVAAGWIRPDDSVELRGSVDMSFALASVTKLLTAVTVLIGVEEGSLELDQPTYEEGATLADLLGHASGLDADGGRLGRTGHRRIYSNAGYEIAASSLQERTGIPFPTYMHEAIFDPLEMASTRLTGSPAHGAESTVNDLLRFLTGLNGLLASETLLGMVTAHLPELSGVLPGYGRQTPNSWGLGPELRSHKTPHWTGSRNSPSTWGHFGRAGSFLWVDPVAQQSLVVLTDRPFDEWARPLWPALSDAVLAAV